MLSTTYVAGKKSIAEFRESGETRWIAIKDGADSGIDLVIVLKPEFLETLKQAVHVAAAVYAMRGERAGQRESQKEMSCDTAPA